MPTPTEEVPEFEAPEQEAEAPPAAPESEHGEAPMLAEMVAAGELPGVDERLPSEPITVTPHEGIGQYGQTWHMVTKVDPTSHTDELVKYEPLLRYSMGGVDLLPNMAKSWEVSEDGTTFTFYMREGVKWSDGAPLTADDVQFWFEDVISNRELYPAFPNWLKAGGERCTFEKVDDFTVKFTFPGPAPLFERQAGHPWREAYLPKHYLEQFHADYADEEALNGLVEERGFDNWASLFLNHADENVNVDLPVIFAWDMEEYAEDGVTYVRNPYYWKVDTEGNQLPYIDTVQTRVAADVNVAQMMAFSGEADLQTFSVGQFPKDTMLLKENADQGNYHVIEAPISEPNVCVFGLNLTCKDERLRAIFSEKNFRIALSHAIDREQVRQLVYLEQPKEIRQCAPLPNSPFYHEAAAKNYVEYDPDKANALLDEMGLADRDDEGFRLAPDGEPFAITLEIIGKRDDFIDALEMVADWWNAVGVKTTAKPVETSLYFTRRDANELQAGVDYSGNGFYPILNPDDYIPTSGGSVWANAWGTWYATDGESGEEPPEEVKRQLELYDEILVTPNIDKQKELWAEIMDINAENCYHFGFCDRAAVPVVVSNKMHNVPETGWNIAWEAGNIGTTNPCQYWKEA
jgi:peptide/nickel transport system substrate-binding protein